MARLTWHRQWKLKVCRFYAHALWLKPDGSIWCYTEGRRVG